MKAIIQRVTNAKVILNDEIPVSISNGICVLVGFHKEDTLKDLEYIVKKILSVRLFTDDNNKKWQNSVMDKQLEVLIISQYTIYNGWKGNTPDFHKTMDGEKSQEFYTKLIDLAREMYDPEKVKDGVFGIYRQLYLENDGPVTFQIDSPPSCREEK
ncbi:D-aminoacyl-tRNA deacylase-like [Vanessa cardui]|uniref:D-aminoacyl-tRNA deacylase-like n=1 Tax=Vanessa cardui TaxID=171605 RepID=UPI001F137DFF|nr:D-aminoacyl-tRNA deacylase-like [Vanessa cardui]